MKKITGLMLGCATAGVFTQIAHAESQVTLYGILDEGLMYQSSAGGKTGGKKFFLDSTSGISGSRWGMTGSEDLGGGLNAIFTLEGGINLNNGTAAQGGTMFGRQVFVGVNDQKRGSLTFGRQYDMMFYFGQPLTSAGVQGGSALFLHPGDLDNTGNTIRVNNAIRYMSPNYSGLTFGGEYSVGGVAGNVTANSGYSLGFAYAHGPVLVGAAFEYFKNPTSATAGSGFFTNNANGASALSQTLNRGYASATAYQTAIVGGRYAIGPVTLSTSYSNTQYANLGSSFHTRTARFDNVDFAVKYMYAPTLALSVAYDYLKGHEVTAADGSTLGNQHYNQVSVMADYLLSKRTDVYLGGTWQRASGTSSTGEAAVADIANLGDSANNHVFLLRAALRHRF
ncbi:Porin Gram-negative type [Paraburkholderia piptadeniae]|uniref:Porin Gram-negative type n=1 Tax=Paraburkholderia piptadeniae TaxID=1701573 RepID=A0A1N7SDY3_9BURK|nr:porin [Paraburkholderia piptadeniae]SIT45628.1 Porin Gram-negative type [Paraburkholderia piptadeniae]